MLSTSMRCSMLTDYGCKVIIAQVLATKTPVMEDCKQEFRTRSHFFLKLLCHCNKVSNKYSPYCGTLWNLRVEGGLYITEMEFYGYGFCVWFLSLSS